MNGEISNPHDKLFKQVLGEPENAASFLAENLPEEIASLLDLSTLQVVQASFIDTQFIQSEADLLFTVTIANRPGYVYFLFEHQSSPDAFMILRLLGYMVRVWKRFKGSNPKCDLLPAIIPMVLYHGPRGWQGPLTFRSLVDIPAESFTSYTPDFQCRLYDLSPFGMERVAGNALVRILGDLLGAFGRPDFEDRLRRALETLNELLNAPGFARYLEIFFRYMLQVFNIPKEDLGQMVTGTLKRDVKEFIMTTYEQLIREGEEKGEEKGRQEGRVEAGAAILSRQLAKRFRVDAAPLVPLLDGLDFVQYEELSEKILEAENMEEVLEWIEAARHN